MEKYKDFSDFKHAVLKRLEEEGYSILGNDGGSCLVLDLEESVNSWCYYDEEEKISRPIINASPPPKEDEKKARPSIYHASPCPKYECDTVLRRKRRIGIGDFIASIGTFFRRLFHRNVHKRNIPKNDISNSHNFVSSISEIREFKNNKNILSLNAMAFDAYLERQYKDRFEELKNNPSYVRMLITEAAENIKYMYD